MAYIEPFAIKWEGGDDYPEKDGGYAYCKNYFAKEYSLRNTRHAREGVYRLDGEDGVSEAARRFRP